MTVVLLSAAASACGRATAVVAAQRVEIATVAATTPPVTRQGPTCPEGYRPATEFVRTDWLGAYRAVKSASSIWVDADPVTSEQARDGLCLGTSGIVGMPPNLKTTCQGEYWIISTEHQHYTDHTFVIVPRGDEAIVFDAGQIGGGMCSGEQSSTLSSIEVKLAGSELGIKASSESFEWSEGAAAAEACQRSHTDVALYRYDLGTGLACETFYVE